MVATTDRTLTIERARTDPISLVNATDEELHALFAEVLECRQDVAAAVEFVAAWRTVLELATATPRDVVAEVRTFSREVLPRWKQHAPWTQIWPVVAIMHGPEEVLRFTDVEDVEDRSVVWRCLRDRTARNELAEARKPVAWEAFWEGYEADLVGRCQRCGIFFIRHKFAPERKFCCGYCRKAQHETTRHRT